MTNALSLVRAKLADYPDHGATGAMAVYRISGPELGIIEAALEAHERLRRAAKDVVARWDSPQWKWDQHTGVFIADLRAAADENPATNSGRAR